MSGWVYVVTNKSIRALVKVGYTTRRDLNQRLREFDQAGLPYPYERAYALWVEEPRLIEKQVHQALAIHRENKEWFRCSVEHAKETIEQMAGPESVKAMALRAAEEERLRSQAIEAAEGEHQRLIEEAQRAIVRAKTKERRIAIEEAQRALARAKTEERRIAQRALEWQRRLPTDWDRLRAKRPSDPQTRASQPPGRPPDRADEGDQEPARKRGQPQIQRDHLTWQASEDLAPKPGWKLLEEVEGRTYRKIRRQEDRHKTRRPPSPGGTFPWDFWLPVIIFLVAILIGGC